MANAYTMVLVNGIAQYAVAGMKIAQVGAAAGIQDHLVRHVRSISSTMRRLTLLIGIA